MSNLYIILGVGIFVIFIISLMGIIILKKKYNIQKNINKNLNKKITHNKEIHYQLLHNFKFEQHNSTICPYCFHEINFDIEYLVKDFKTISKIIHVHDKKSLEFKNSDKDKLIPNQYMCPHCHSNIIIYIKNELIITRKHYLLDNGVNKFYMVKWVESEGDENLKRELIHLGNFISSLEKFEKTENYNNTFLKEYKIGKYNIIINDEFGIQYSLPEFFNLSLSRDRRK